MGKAKAMPAKKVKEEPKCAGCSQVKPLKVPCPECRQFGVDPMLHQFCTAACQKEHAEAHAASIHEYSPLKLGQHFIESHKDDDGVLTLPSGLMIKRLKEAEPGTPDESPIASSECVVHYTGMDVYNRVFDSSVERGKPSIFTPTQVIKAWTEALQMMKETEKWTLYAPHELAYGVKGAPPKIPGCSVLIFDVELIKINGEKKPYQGDPWAEKKE